MIVVEFRMAGKQWRRVDSSRPRRSLPNETDRSILVARSVIGHRIKEFLYDNGISVRWTKSLRGVDHCEIRRHEAVFVICNVSSWVDADTSRVPVSLIVSSFQSGRAACPRSANELERLFYG